ncbi:CNNM domain-containing protein [Myxococcota bacterium]
MTTAWLLLLVYVGIALSMSFLCSVLEATLLSVRITELAGRKEQGDRGAAILLELKQNRIDESISAILTLNTIAHTIGAAMAGAQAAIVFGDPWVGVFSAVLTVLVLVVTEIIPKTIGTVFASELAGFVGRTVRLLIVLLWPIVRILNGLTRLISRRDREPISRVELAALVRMAARQGTLAGDESRMFDNVLHLDEIRISDVMTPRTVAVMLPIETTIGELLQSRDADIFSRIPLYQDTRDQIVGYLLQRDVLGAAARECDQSRTLVDFRRECLFVPANAPLSTTLREFLTKREHMAIVADEFGAVAGLVTLEDLIETVLGVEIVDERDKVVDMREQAIKLRDERMKRMRASAFLGQKA